MFENRSEKQLIIIYAVIALVVALGLAVFHLMTIPNLLYIVVAVNIEFFCIFYILYLPLKIKRSKKK